MSDALISSCLVNILVLHLSLTLWIPLARKQAQKIANKDSVAFTHMHDDSLYFSYARTQYTSGLARDLALVSVGLAHPGHTTATLHTDSRDLPD
jgi:hypothetical protein